MAFSLVMQPLQASASTGADDVVVAPDPAYVAFELQSSRESIAASSTSASVRLAAIPEARITRLARRPFQPFGVIDPKTGKTVTRDTMISVPASPPQPGPNGEPGGGPGSHRQVQAGPYWDEVNKFEQAATASGASLRDTRPTLTAHVNGLKPGAFSASEVARIRSIPPAKLPDAGQAQSDATFIAALAAGAVATYPKDLPISSVMPPKTAEQILIELDKKLEGDAGSIYYPPCLNNPKNTLVNAPEVAIVRNSLAGNALNMIGPTPAPTPTRFIAKVTAPIVTTHPTNAIVVLASPSASPTPGILGMSAAERALTSKISNLPLLEIQYEQRKCPIPPALSSAPLPQSHAEADLASFLGTPPGQPKPLDIAFGDKSIAALELTGNISIGGAKTSSGQPAPTLNGNVTLLGYLLGNNATLASAAVQTGGPGASSLTIMAAGKSIGGITLNPGHNPSSLSPITQTFFSTTVPIPLFAGLNLDLAAAVTGSLTPSYDIFISPNSLTDSLSLSLTAALNGTFSASLDVSFLIFDISVGIALSVTFLTLTAKAIGGIALAMIDQTIGGKTDTNPRDIRDCQLSLQYEDGVGLSGTALQGTISFYIQECVDYFIGSSCAQQGMTLDSWPGFPIDAGSSNPTWKTIPIGPYYTDGPEYGVPLKTNEVYSEDDKPSAIPEACNKIPIVYGS